MRDAGNGAYDRINGTHRRSEAHAEGNPEAIEVFIKNRGTACKMKVYRDGSLFHSGAVQINGVPWVCRHPSACLAEVDWVR